MIVNVKVSAVRVLKCRIIKENKTKQNKWVTPKEKKIRTRHAFSNETNNRATQNYKSGQNLNLVEVR